MYSSSFPTPDIFSNDVCGYCHPPGTPGDWVVIETGERVCQNCGTIDPHYREFDDRPVYQKPDPWAQWWNPNGVIISEGVQSTKGRYKERFHYNERMAQWCLEDPPIPQRDWDRLIKEANTGQYGPSVDFTRAVVIKLTRATGLVKYRERWKTVLCVFHHGKLDTPLPDDELRGWLFRTFDRLVDIFPKYRGTMAGSVLHNGKRERHNLISYNYTQRKFLEARGIWDYHNEFPIPRSHHKLHSLDDVFEHMAKDLGLSFTRTCVIKRPKIKRKKASVTVYSG